LIGLADALTRLGRCGVAVTHAVTATELARDASLGVRHAQALSALATAHLRAGDGDRARRAAAQAARQVQITGWAPPE
jgi:hypothetical protein